MIEFGVLGPLVVHRDGAPVRIEAARLRRLLAVLLCRAGQPVPTETLAGAVWDTAPPANPRQTLQLYAHRLRRALGEGAPLQHGPAGYSVVVGPDRLDALRFTDLTHQARTARRTGDLAGAGARLRQALDLWRGEAYADIPAGPIITGEADRLTEQRLQVMEEHLAVDLDLGRHAELVAELATVAGTHPYRERVRALLMLALYRAGRRAEALDAFRDTRTRLASDLGVEPGTLLQLLHQAILRADPRLAQLPTDSLAQLAQPAGRAPAVASPQPRPVPRELPPDVANFIGRHEELKLLDTELQNAGVATAPVVILTIAGTAGVGKTALAVHWAHQVAGEFPDGQLYVDLRGYDPSQPMPPADALARFLAALGVASRDIPLELADRAARYRTAVAGRRLLIVLDNAATVEQVRPLLPGSGSCAVLVTSRDSLAGLVAVNGAGRLALDLLPLAEAVTLLRRLIGHRVDAEPDAAATLAGQCARLPLALRITAELAVARPAVPLANLAAEVADRRRRLDLLDSQGDPRSAVVPVFSWSIQHLPPGAARMFRLLGLHPGPDVEPYAAAALTGTGLDPARRALDRLVRAHLLHLTGTGRYGMHDLLRAYATHLATTADTAQQRQAAQDRLFDHYLATAAAAMDSWYPAGVHGRPRVTMPATRIPELADPDTARAWLDAERPCLVAVAAHTASHGWPSHAVRLSSTLYRYFDSGHYLDGLAIHGHAHRAAEQAGDLAEQAHALRYLGTVHGRLGSLGSAADHLRQALDRLRRAGDRTGEASALASLGVVEQQLGHHAAAIGHHERALTRFREAGDRTGEANALVNLGVAQGRIGREPAAEHFRQALAIFEQLGNPRGEAYALINLGNVEEQRGRYAAAAGYHRQALDRFRKLANRDGEAHALDSLGTVHIRLGEPERAAERFQQALTLFQEIGDRDGETWARNGLGEAAQLAGRPADALSHHTTAYDLATTTGARDQQARADAGLGRAHLALGERTRARTHIARALAGYTDLELPDAEELRTLLAALGG